MQFKFFLCNEKNEMAHVLVIFSTVDIILSYENYYEIRNQKIHK